MTMLLLLALIATAPPSAPLSVSDTIRLEVASSAVDGRVYAPHAARVRVWVGPGDGRMRAEWTNVLTVGDSAGRQVHRWVTTGTQFTASGDTVQWQLRQTYDARTLLPRPSLPSARVREERLPRSRAVTTHT